MGMFGAHLAVLRQPLRAAGRSTAADGSAAGARARPARRSRRSRWSRSGPSRDLTQAAGPAEAARRGGQGARRADRGARRPAARRAAGWIVGHAAAIGVKIEMRAAHLLAERIGGAIWETDIERGEMTRVADSRAAQARDLCRRAVDRGRGRRGADGRHAAGIGLRDHECDRPARAGGRGGGAARALAEGQPGLRILASLAGRVCRPHRGARPRGVGGRRRRDREAGGARQRADGGAASRRRRAAIAARSWTRCSSACSRRTWRSRRT